MPKRTKTLTEKRGRPRLFTPPRHRDAFYSSARWRKLRDWFMGRPENALCRRCRQAGATTPAVVCDHIVPRQVRPDLELVATNLQPLCRACDNKKTAEDVKRGEAGRATRVDERGRSDGIRNCRSGSDLVDVRRLSL